MAKLTRKFVRTTLDGEGTTDEKLEAIMTAFGASTAGMIDKEELEAEKQKAVKEALKNTPKDYKESKEWKDMESKVAEYQRKEQIHNLTAKGVKNEKYAEMLLSKLDAEKDIDEQLEAFKEDYADMFSAGTVEHEDTPPNTPQFGASTKGSMPRGDKKTSFGDVWGFVPKKE